MVMDHLNAEELFFGNIGTVALSGSREYGGVIVIHQDCVF